MKFLNRQHATLLCIANNIINGSQCTIVWHVDNLKQSHKDPKVIDNIIAPLDDEYGKTGKMTVQRGKNT